MKWVLILVIVGWIALWLDRATKWKEYEDYDRHREEGDDDE